MPKSGRREGSTDQLQTLLRVTAGARVLTKTTRVSQENLSLSSSHNCSNRSSSERVKGGKKEKCEQVVGIVGASGEGEEAGGEVGPPFKMNSSWRESVRSCLLQVDLHFFFHCSRCRSAHPSAPVPSSAPRCLPAPARLGWWGDGPARAPPISYDWKRR